MTRTFFRAMAHALRRALLAAVAGSLFAPALAAQAPAAPAAVQWPTKDGVYTIKDFRFGTGEALAELRLHYLTLGSPHTNAAGHVDNAVLLLHGTGGNASTLLVPQFSTVLF